jgi:hypothetical protein
VIVPKPSVANDIARAGPTRRGDYFVRRYVIGSRTPARTGGAGIFDGKHRWSFAPADDPATFDLRPSKIAERLKLLTADQAQG